MSNVNEVINILRKEYPNAKCALSFEDPLQMLVSTILSAQCTDKRVNIVTQALFKKYKTPKDYYTAKPGELEQDIRSTGFYRNKAKNIKASCRLIDEKFGGKVPRTMESILELPGVARKTANIVLYNSYGTVAGIPVDTHVKRVSYRLGLTKNTNPEKIEQDLMKILPKKEWGPFSYLIIEHGRAVCKAPTPFCSKCVLDKICPKQGVVKRK